MPRKMLCAALTPFAVAGISRVKPPGADRDQLRIAPFQSPTASPAEGSRVEFWQAARMQETGPAANGV
jgi:hypothetical protein